MNDHPKIVPLEIQPPSIATMPITPMAMLSVAVSQGAGVDVLERLMGLQERWQQHQRRSAFDAAISAAKAEIPVITKNREVDFTSQKGRTNYSYEDLGQIARVIDPILGKYGLSYRWRTSSTPNEPVVVTCIIAHKDGHYEENSLSAGRDESGSKNGIQAIGSAITYLQRYTLKAALGLAASKDDDDNGAGKRNPDLISDEEAAELSAGLTETKSNIDAFLRVFRIECLPDLPKVRFTEAKTMIEKKKAALATVAKTKENVT